MQKFDSYTHFQDERGSFTGIINQNGPWEEINYIETKAHKIRGGHYHKETLELFFILEGEIEITIENKHQNWRECFVVTKGCIFMIEPYEIHTFRVLQDSKWINVLSKKMDNRNPDIFVGNKQK